MPDRVCIPTRQLWPPGEIMKFVNAVVRLFVVLILSASPLQAEILIGFAGPMTGPRAWSGQQFQRGAEQAVS